VKDAVSRSSLCWWALLLAAIAVSSSYYEDDIIGPIADLLHRQRGFSQAQLGLLNGVISIPNIGLALFSGMAIDRFGPARVACWAAGIGVLGAALTAVGQPYELMVAGRFIFGISEGAIFIALIAGLARWFSRSGIALATALYLSLARAGSYAVDTSTAWASPLYAKGWQAPLWLGAAITLAGFAAAAIFYWLDKRYCPRAATPTHVQERIRWSELFSFDMSFWCILGLHSWVFFAAMFTTPIFGLLADRLGHRALMLTFGTLLLPLTFIVLGLTDLNLWVSTVMMGISFSLVPAVIWPATTLIVEPRRLGTALGLITLIQALGMAAANVVAGWLADRAGAGAQNPAGYSVMLWFFFLLSLTALTSAILLWRRESGNLGHGLEQARVSTALAGH
jgi:MFS family permease